ncbi:MAG: competence/damage-inducible protein A [Gaiellales bacterium]|nr:competence/damage-inducible protein A [Gaiellales bacterium]
MIVHMHGTAEMIFTGDELLRGDIVNSNQAFLGEALLRAGLFATHSLCVADSLDLIAHAVEEALARQPDVLLLSGGLGPTEDDLTREAVAQALGLELVHHEELLEQVAARFQTFNMSMPPSNLKQALLPHGAHALPFTGTAPGFWLAADDTIIAALPGVPRELHVMWDKELAPLLRQRLDTTTGVEVRRLRVAGMGEGTLAEALRGLSWKGGDVEIGTRAGAEGITLVLRCATGPEAHAHLDTAEHEVRRILGRKIFGTGNADMAEAVGHLLRAHGLTAATAESCSGGLIAKRFTDVAGSSDYFQGGVVSYSNQAKIDLLGVEEELLQRHGAVSPEVAAAMARGAAERLHADCAVSTTGIAGPGGGSEEKPVGLVYVATAVHGDVETARYLMFRTRQEIRTRTAQTALDLLRLRLLTLGTTT